MLDSMCLLLDTRHFLSRHLPFLELRLPDPTVMMFTKLPEKLALVCLCLVVFTGCKGKIEQPTNHVPLDTFPPDFTDLPEPDVIYPPVQPLPRVGDTSFYSAGGFDGEVTGLAKNSASWMESNTDGEEVNQPPQVSDESVIAWLDEQHTRLLHLHLFRGLRVLDVSEPSSPEVIGELFLEEPLVRVSKIEARRGFAYIFLKDEVQVFDLTDPTAPTFVATYEKPAERLEYDFGAAGTILSFAPEEASSETPRWELCSRITTLTGEIEEVECHTFESKSEPKVYRGEEMWSVVTDSEESVSMYFVDVSDPSGELSLSEPFEREDLGTEVTEPFFDIHENILSLVVRSNEVVPGSITEERLPIFVLETYDIADMSNPVLIDSKKFGYNRTMNWSVFASGTISLGLSSDSGYLRIGFHVDDQGVISVLEPAEENRLVPYIQRYLGGGRLHLSLGHFDAEARGLEVQLLDGEATTDRIQVVKAGGFDSENHWIDIELIPQVIHIEEDVVSMLSEDGTEETNAIVVPFQGFDTRERQPGSSAYLFTFSNSTITYRGMLPTQDAPLVQVAFAERGVLTTTSATGVRLIDLDAPEGAAEILAIDMAPIFEDIWIMGDYIARQRSLRATYSWWPIQVPDWRKESRIEIIRAGEDMEYADALAHFSIPEQARVIQSGELLIVLSEVDSAEPETRFYIEVWDLADPSEPKRRGGLQTRRPARLVSSDPSPECAGCLVRAAFRDVDVKVVGDKLVFATIAQHEESVGDKHVRRFFPLERNSSVEQGCAARNSPSPSEACVYQTGSIICSQIALYNLSRTPETCVGELLICKIQDGQKSCRRTTPTEILTSVDVGSDRDHVYRWNSTRLEIVDLSSMGQLTKHTLELPEGEQSAGWVSSEGRLFVNFKTPHSVPGDGRAYMRYFTRQIDLSDPENPVLGEPINLPGRLVDARGDTLLVHDYRWGELWTEGAIHLLELEDDVATLTETLGSFGDVRIDQIVWLEDQSIYVVAHGMKIRYRNDVILEDPDPYRARLLGRVTSTGRRVSTGLVDADADLLAVTDDVIVFDDAVVYDASARDRLRPSKRLDFRGDIFGYALHGETLITAQGMYGLVTYDLDPEAME
mgnify:FL=1